MREQQRSKEAVSAGRRKGWRRWALRLGLLLLAVELAWLAGVNLALSLPVTQAWLNTLRPERVQVSWQRAHSLYPGRVVAEGVVVSGQSPRQQWQVEAERAVASVSLLPLLLRRVQVSRGEVENVRYRQRPRLEPGRDYGDALDRFPEIRGYDLAPQGEYAPPRPVWTVTAHDVQLTGSHALWIRRAHAELDATAVADVDTRTQGGPLTLRAHSVEIDLRRGWVDEDQEVASDGRLSGSFQLGPYPYREHRGLQALRFLDLDLELELESRSLDFVRLFLLKYPSLETGGAGAARGRLVLRGGAVAGGTDIQVEASDLVVAQAPFRATGNGELRMAADVASPLPFTVAFRFDDLQAFHYEDHDPFFTGRGMTLRVEDDGELLPAPDADGPGQWQFRALLGVPEAVVDDMRTFNRYLPGNSPFRFSGGSADLRATMALTPYDASGELTLHGEELSAELDGQAIGLGLRFDGVIAGGRPREGLFDLAGSELTLDRARVLGDAARFEEDDWSARAVMPRATLQLAQPVGLDLAADLSISDTRPLAAVFRNHGGPAWIARRLTVAGISGAAAAVLRDGRLFVPDAHLESEELAVGMRGLIQEPQAEGMLYLRYKKLDALLSIEDGKRHVTVFDPQGKFEAYEVKPPDAP